MRTVAYCSGYKVMFFVVQIAYNYYGTKPHPKLEMAKNEGVLSETSTSLTYLLYMGKMEKLKCYFNVGLAENYKIKIDSCIPK